MKIVPIFDGDMEGGRKGLFAISQDGNPEHNAFFSFLEWLEDTEEMTRFFTETHRQQALKYGYYAPIEISEALERTRREADVLLAHIEDAFEKGIAPFVKLLDEVFKPLDNSAATAAYLAPNKTRGIEKNLPKRKKFWIRIYAVKVEPGFYIVTGGSVKLFKYMDEDPALDQQKAKLLRVRDFLKAEGLYDSESIEELIIER